MNYLKSLTQYVPNFCGFFLSNVLYLNLLPSKNARVNSIKTVIVVVEAKHVSNESICVGGIIIIIYNFSYSRE